MAYRIPESFKTIGYYNLSSNGGTIGWNPPISRKQGNSLVPIGSSIEAQPPTATAQNIKESALLAGGGFVAGKVIGLSTTESLYAGAAVGITS